MCEDEGQDDREGLGPDFVAGFIGLLCCLHFIRIWRLAYIETVNDVYGWIKVSILLNLARLKRRFF